MLSLPPNEKYSVPLNISVRSATVVSVPGMRVLAWRSPVGGVDGRLVGIVRQVTIHVRMLYRGVRLVVGSMGTTSYWMCTLQMVICQRHEWRESERGHACTARLLLSPRSWEGMPQYRELHRSALWRCPRFGRTCPVALLVVLSPHSTYAPENRQLRCKNLSFGNWRSLKNLVFGFGFTYHNNTKI